jgi:hypothetical protein
MKYLIALFAVFFTFPAFFAAAQDEPDITVHPKGVKGVGYSPYYKKAVDEGVARNEALLNAQKNALINYGGYIRLETEHQQNELTEGNKNNYQSDFHLSSKQIMRGMVKTVDGPYYRYKKEGNNKYIVAEGEFEIHPEGLEDLISLFINTTGRKIKIELTDNASGAKIYPMLREYFNLKQNNFLFADRNHIFKSTDVFVINVFNDYIEFTMKQFNHNRYEQGPILKTFMFSTFHYKNCLDFINSYNSSAPNPIFNNLISEFYQVYFTNNSDAF